MRSTRGQVWPYLLLSVALFGALGFGWYQTRLKNQLALDAENKYMAAFHRLKWTSENVEERLALLMAAGDPQMQETLLADLRVYSAQAVEHMASLPFLTLETPRIQQFLNDLRQRSDEMHHKLANGDALGEAERAQLQELRQQAVHFEAQLSDLLGLVGNNMLRWQQTVRVTSPAETGQATTPITQSVVELDQKLQAPPGEEGALAPGGGPMAMPKISPGPRVDQATAFAAVRRFVDMPLKGEPVLQGTSDPEDRVQEFSLYFIQATKENGLVMNFGVSVHGGHVLYMLDGRPVTKKEQGPDELVDRARQMLQKRGYSDLEFVSAVENDGTLLMEFAPKEGGVAMHVQMIKIMLAMDNGELVGFDARNYWTNRQPRSLSAPAISAAEVVGRVSPQLQVTGQPVLALVADRRARERLVWEVRGTVADQRYRIFLDAADGREVSLLRVAGDPAPPFNEGQ